MRHLFYAVFKDQCSPELRIRIYPELIQAEKACNELGSDHAEVIRFWCSDRLMHKDDVHPIYLAVTLEDTGYRIHGAFDSIMGLRTFQLAHSSESPCHSLIAWPGARSHDKIHPYPLQVG